MVRISTIVAFGLAAFGLQQTAYASPVSSQASRSLDLAKRSKYMKCGYIKKDDTDLGCVCDSSIWDLDLDFDKSDLIGLLLSKPGKNYPPGCRPTCDVSPTLFRRRSFHGALIGVVEFGPSRTRNTNVRMERTRRGTVTNPSSAPMVSMPTMANVVLPVRTTLEEFGTSPPRARVDRRIKS
jgi:hypothetical protein